MIETVKEKFGKEHKISVMFENCISNTLSTTIKMKMKLNLPVKTG